MPIQICCIFNLTICSTSKHLPPLCFSFFAFKNNEILHYSLMKVMFIFKLYFKLHQIAAVVILYFFIIRLKYS